MITYGLDANLTSNLLTFPGLSVSLIVILLQIATIGRAYKQHGILAGRPAIVALLSSWVLLVGTAIWQPLLNNDALIWHARGVEVMRHLDGSLPGAVSDFGGKDGYPWLLGAIYWVVGPTPIVPALLNILLFIALQITLAGIIRHLLESDPDLNQLLVRRVSSIFLSVAALSPVVVIWVPTLLRETLCWYLIAFATLSVVRAVGKRNLTCLIPAIPALAVLYLVRDSVGLGVSMALVAAVVFVWPKSRYKLAIRTLVVVVAGVVGVPVWHQLSTRFGLSAEEVSMQIDALSREATTSFSVSSESSAGMFVQVFPRVVMGPFPWEWNFSGGMVLSIAGLIMWLLVLAFAFRYRLPSKRQPDSREAAFQIVLVLVIVIIALVLMQSVAPGNYGIITRFRMMPQVLILPLSCLGMASVLMARVRRSEYLAGRPRVSRTHIQP